MKDFFERPIVLEKFMNIGSAMPGMSGNIMRNRKSPGLVFFPAASSVFSFDNGTTLATKRGSIIFAPEGSNYDVLKGEEEDIGRWYINFSPIEPLKSEAFVMSFKSPEKIANLFVAAEKIYQERRTAYDSKLRSIFYEILSLMETEYNQKYLPSSTAKRIDSAVEYIKQNCFDKNINIQQLADLCGVSATYFRRIFSEVYGVSPVKYINSLRIKRAKELIDSQMYASVSDIALLCGFSDDCYFRKVFKAETLMTPKEFAQLSKKQ